MSDTLVHRKAKREDVLALVEKLDYCLLGADRATAVIALLASAIALSVPDSQRERVDLTVLVYDTTQYICTRLAECSVAH